MTFFNFTEIVPLNRPRPLLFYFKTTLGFSNTPTHTDIYYDFTT